MQYKVDLAGDFRKDCFIVTDEDGNNVFEGTKSQVENWLGFQENQSRQSGDALIAQNRQLRALLEDIRLSAFTCEDAGDFTIGVQEQLKNNPLLSPFREPKF